MFLATSARVFPVPGGSGFFLLPRRLEGVFLFRSVEIIRLGNSFYIDWDRKMYFPQTDTPAQARTTTLNEELGQIKYVFSDKTGTLTQNVMVFNKCSIDGKSYGRQGGREGGSLLAKEPWLDSPTRSQVGNTVQEAKGSGSWPLLAPNTGRLPFSVPRGCGHGGGGEDETKDFVRLPSLWHPGEAFAHDV